MNNNIKEFSSIEDQFITPVLGEYESKYFILRIQQQ